MNSRRWGILLITLISCLELGCSLLKISGDENLEKKTSKRESANVSRMRLNLKNIEASIGVTRERIRGAQEIQFMPDLYFMLAELLVDKSKLLYSIKRELNPKAPEAELDFTAERKVRTEAIETLKMIEDRYPQYVALDKAIYTLGLEQKEMSDLDQAQQTFKRLAEKFSQSSYRELALIEVGNIFFEKKDYEFAFQQYEKAAKNEKSEHVGLAKYKMGLCFLQRGEFGRALDLFLDVMEKDSNLKPDIRDEILMASVWPFSEAGPEDLRKHPGMHKPVQFYRSISPDKVNYRRVLKKLASRLELKKRDQDALLVWQELMRVSDDVNERSEAMETSYLIGKKLKLDYYSEDYVSAVIRTLNLVRSDEINRLNLKKNFERFEPILRDILTVNQGAALKNKRKDDFESVIRGYQDYLWLFPTSAQAGEMKVNLAEALYQAGRKVAAGLAYFEITERHSKYSRSKELFESAIQSFSEAFKENEELGLLEKVRGRRGFRDLSRSFARKFPRDPSVPLVKFNYARSLYDEQRFDVAVKALRAFVYKYPNDKNSEAAAMLLLDCYFVRDDLKGMVEEGKLILGRSSLSSAVKAKISQTIQQSQLKNVRSVAGDFASKEYADQFLEFARQNKGSALGETATLEAFSSLRSANDLRMFEIGEQFLGQFPNSAKSKDVLTMMIQQSLLWFDFRNAAKYLAAYGMKFKDDAAARGFLEQGLQVYESLGNAVKASWVAEKLGQVTKATSILFEYGLYDQVVTKASQLAGIEGAYFQGVSLLRLGKKSDGLVLLNRVLTMAPSSQLQKSMIAHAGIITAENSLEMFSKLGMGEEFSPGLLQAKNQAYQEIDKQIQTVLTQGDGLWSVSGLHLSAILNEQFFQFFKSLRSPKAVSPEVFQKMIGPQSAQFKKASEDLLGQCVRTAEENDVLSPVTKYCAGKSFSLISETKVKRPRQQGQPKDDSSYMALRQKISKSSRDIRLIRELANISYNHQDYHFTELVLQRLYEIDPSQVQALADSGTMELYKSNFEGALQIWQSVLKTDQKNLSALAGLSGVYREFGLLGKSSQASGKMAGKRATGLLHTLMK